MNGRCCREVLDCASALALFEGDDASKSGRGLPQSRTLARWFTLPMRDSRIVEAFREPRRAAGILPAVELGALMNRLCTGYSL